MRVLPAFLRRENQDEGGAEKLRRSGDAGAGDRRDVGAFFAERR